MSLQYIGFIRWVRGLLLHMEKMKYSYRISVENPASRRPLTILEVNIKTACKKCVNVKWTHLGQSRVQWLRCDLLQ